MRYVVDMKSTGHKSHVSGWRRFQREFRRRDERKDLARYMQRQSANKVLDKSRKGC